MTQWSIKSAHSENIASLALSLSVSKRLARLLINRGLVTSELAHPFLFHGLSDLPNPFLLKGMEEAVQRIISAIDKKEKVTIYGDYDVDGTCATSLLILFFREINYPVFFYIPHRMREGYSLNNQALQKIKEDGTHVVITVDNGISSVNEANFAKSIGLDLIITDHHEVPQNIPEAFAVINPLQPNCGYPAKEICGSGVAFNLIMALRQRLRERGFFKNQKEPNLKNYLDLVSLATVADVVPLKGVNRIFVREGLKSLTNTQRSGVKALKSVAGINGEVEVSHLGFRLGPRLNACGRLYDAAAGVRLLTSTNIMEANQLANELDDANKERQAIEVQIVKEACIQVENDKNFSEKMSYVLYDDKWHPGVVGIVASRLVARYSRPMVVLGKDKENILKGSARSFGGLHLVEALRDCSELLIKCGGHKAAAGLSLHAENLETFRKIFEEKVSQRITSDDCLPYYEIDEELSLADIDSGLIDEISRLAPFGQGNPEPLFCGRAFTALNSKVVGDKHLKFSVKSQNSFISAIAFGQAEQRSLLNDKIDCLFTCDFDSYRGDRSILLTVKKIKAS